MLAQINSKGDGTRRSDLSILLDGFGIRLTVLNRKYINKNGVIVKELSPLAAG